MVHALIRAAAAYGMGWGGGRHCWGRTASSTAPGDEPGRGCGASCRGRPRGRGGGRGRGRGRGRGGPRPDRAGRGGRPAIHVRRGATHCALSMRRGVVRRCARRPSSFRAIAFPAACRETSGLILSTLNGAGTFSDVHKCRLHKIEIQNGSLGPANSCIPNDMHNKREFHTRGARDTRGIWLLEGPVNSCAKELAHQKNAHKEFYCALPYSPWRGMLTSILQRARTALKDAEEHPRMTSNHVQG